ncbi:MAG: hypothetical protein HQL48_08490 [Gammaproteobacteria bacterium]|nr:hypothetical protein [Gammaproteobacteria bacterium]
MHFHLKLSWHWLFTLGVALSLPPALLSAQPVEEDLWQSSYTLEKEGDYAAAEAILQPLLQVEGDHREFALLRSGWLSYLRQHYNEAIGHYRQAMAVNPFSLDAELGLVLVLQAQLRWKEAKIYANSVLKRAPANYNAHLYLMAALSAQGEWTELEKAAKKVHAFYPTEITPLLQLARALAWQMREGAALEAYHALLRRSPTNAEALNYIQARSSN